MTRNRHALLMRISQLSVGNKHKIPRDSETSVPGKKNGSESIVSKDCCTVPPTTGIDGNSLPLLRDANATWMPVC